VQHPSHFPRPVILLQSPRARPSPLRPNSLVPPVLPPPVTLNPFSPGPAENNDLARLPGPQKSPGRLTEVERGKTCHPGASGSTYSCVNYRGRRGFVSVRVGLVKTPAPPRCRGDRYEWWANGVSPTGGRAHMQLEDMILVSADDQPWSNRLPLATFFHGTLSRQVPRPGAPPGDHDGPER